MNILGSRKRLFDEPPTNNFLTKSNKGEQVPNKRIMSIFHSSSAQTPSGQVNADSSAAACVCDWPQFHAAPSQMIFRL